MAKGSESKLTQKLSQNLSTWQIQLMQMVALPHAELAERIKQELIENPALEEGPADHQDQEENTYEAELGETKTAAEIDMDNYMDPDEVPDATLKRYNSEKKAAFEIPFSEDPTLLEQLEEQLLMSSLSHEDQKIARFIIGSLDDDGYLRRSLEGLVDDLAIYQGVYIEVQDLERILKVIQTLDPPGVAARSLQECLLIQLKRCTTSPIRDLAIRITSELFDLFSKKQFNKLQEVTGATDEELKEASAMITSLNPTPGLDYTSKLEDTFMTVIPDFQVTESQGDLVVTLLSGDIPEVRISKSFEEQMQEYTGDLRKLSGDQKDAGRFIKQKIDDARWFVEMIKQRNNTLISTMLAIVDYQRDYFLTGDIHLLRPMILKDIAEMTNYDISTISRVTSTKYVQTDFGLFPLKHFFSEGTMRDDGTEMSTRTVKELLADIIAGEDKRHPLSDEELRNKMKEHGYNVARRTVAKYRDMMNIPIARLRKEL
ncbi:RNA polymerase factor sigma-54 [Porphyromonadaceae bacterium W3.11]|nr:RNA polymerase factor sigma-54 [Porphyromonadaceae bacterium W3.11]